MFDIFISSVKSLIFLLQGQAFSAFQIACSSVFCLCSTESLNCFGLSLNSDVFVTVVAMVSYPFAVTWCFRAKRTSRLLKLTCFLGNHVGVDF